MYPDTKPQALHPQLTSGLLRRCALAAVQQLVFTVSSALGRAAAFHILAWIVSRNFTATFAAGRRCGSRGTGLCNTSDAVSPCILLLVASPSGS